MHIKFTLQQEKDDNNVHLTTRQQYATTKKNSWHVRGFPWHRLCGFDCQNRLVVGSFVVVDTNTNEKELWNCIKKEKLVAIVDGVKRTSRHWNYPKYDKKKKKPREEWVATEERESLKEEIDLQ